MKGTISPMGLISSSEAPKPTWSLHGRGCAGTWFSLWKQIRQLVVLGDEEKSGVMARDLCLMVKHRAEQIWEEK